MVIGSSPNSHKSPEWEEREVWHKLVVKIICWKDKVHGDKITKEEWKIYCWRMIKINVSRGEQKIYEELKETEQAIKNYGGFKK